MFGEIDGERPPARADFGDMHARLQLELGGDVPKLVALRLVQAVFRRGVVGA